MENVDIEVKAVSNVVSNLQQEPQTLALFLVDLDAGLHTTWDLYKTAAGHLKELGYKGRSVPARKSKGGGGMATCFGKINGKERTNLFSGQIRLEGLTMIQKVKAILASDCDKEVKKELLETHIE